MAASHKAAYAEKLKDPRWQKKRLQIMERDGWACRYCNETTKTLQVHHTKYAIGDPWNTPDFFLLTLCDECHEHETNGRKTAEGMLLDVLRATAVSAPQISYLAQAFLEFGERTCTTDKYHALCFILANKQCWDGFINAFESLDIESPVELPNGQSTD